jgi:hypothetical protein
MPACSSEQGGSPRRGGASAPQTSGEKMTVNKFELKKFTREAWLAMDNQTLGGQLERLDKEYPLVLHTDVGRTFSVVRRM